MISCTGFMTASRPTAFVDAGGGQRTFGVFAEDYLRPECWVFTLGGRLDNWVNSRGFSNRVSVSASPTLATVPNRSEIGGEAGIGLQTRSAAISFGTQLMIRYLCKHFIERDRLGASNLRFAVC